MDSCDKSIDIACGGINILIIPLMMRRKMERKKTSSGEIHNTKKQALPITPQHFLLFSISLETNLRLFFFTITAPFHAPMTKRATAVFTPKNKSKKWLPTLQQDSSKWCQKSRCRATPEQHLPLIHNMLAPAKRMVWKAFGAFSTIFFAPKKKAFCFYKKS